MARAQSGTNYYIFVANDIAVNADPRMSVVEISNELLKEGYWAFTQAAPLRAKLDAGDNVLIYIAGKGRGYFTATAEVASPVHAVTEVAAVKLQKLGLEFLTYVVQLRSVQWLHPVVNIRELVPALEFIKNKKYFGLHLRLPIVRIPEPDYRRIIRR